MTTLLASFVLFVIVVAVMAVLVRLSGKPLKGSCGGVANGGSCACREAGKAEGSCDDELIQIKG